MAPCPDFITGFDNTREFVDLFINLLYLHVLIYLSIDLMWHLMIPHRIHYCHELYFNYKKSCMKISHQEVWRTRKLKAKFIWVKEMILIWDTINCNIQTCIKNVESYGYSNVIFLEYLQCVIYSFLWWFDSYIYTSDLYIYCFI